MGTVKPLNYRRQPEFRQPATLAVLDRQGNVRRVPKWMRIEQ